MTLKKNFSRLTRLERLEYLKNKNLLTDKEIEYLRNSVDLNLIELSEKFVENVIGCFPLPLGIVPGFYMDNKEYTVPMVIEETSVIAAVSKTAKWIKNAGEITTCMHGRDIIGQIQFPKVKNIDACERIIEEKANELLAKANQLVVPNLVARGGGVNYLKVRKIKREDKENSAMMLVVHVYMHPCDAMGANLINQVCEFLRYPLEQLIHEKANMSILSNLVDSKLTEVNIIIRDIDKKSGEKISEAALFAYQDHYRAATHNKGVMNGIDAVLIATGNDWRAVEAGVHAYAARTGQYRSITDWQMDNNVLRGKIVAPIVVGTVGGVTKLHPTAQLNLKLLKISQADELSRLSGSVGLVQNLAALRALTEEGIVRGHMKLHIDNLLHSAGASPEEQKILRKLARKFLTEKGKITLSDMKNLLKQIRSV
jgi:hydroxymethylglutaryl-CoA reductase